MDAKLQKQLTVFGDYTDVDLSTLPAVAGKLTISYSHAAQLAFNVIDGEHTIPIERLAFVRFWLNGTTLDDGETAQSSSHPLFEGFVENVGPGGDSNKVSIVCMDPTFRTARELTVMSVPWVAGFASADPDLQVPPTEGIGAIPRVVYNVFQESDSDYAFVVGAAGTIGQIIAGILDYTQEVLWWRNTCPGTLITGSQSPYVSGDLSGMTFIPQEKIVWESESPRAATERLQRYEPRYRLMWHPGERQWRFRDLTTAPNVTLRLNDPTIDFPVLSLELTPSLDKAYTALKLYGPPTATTEEYTWIDPAVAPDGWTNTLQPVGSPVTLETIGLIDSVVTYKAWQVVDATKRRGARLLPDWYALRTNQYIWENVKYPQFLLSWDAGNTWTGASNVFLDFLTGQAIFPVTAPYCTVENQVNLTGNVLIGQHYFPPNAAKLLWAPYGEPLFARYPAEGYVGTAYTVAGLKVEKRDYDEQLAIGTEYGTPVTSDARIAQMELLAQSEVSKNCDITWVGGCVLDGLDFSWCRLNRSVSFEASDGSGGTITTGWESINCYVTDVEYDFEEKTTTLTFSSDRAETIGEDVANIKQRLGIRQLEQRTYQTENLLFRTEMNWRGDKFQELSGVQINSGFDYVDPMTGRTVAIH